MTERKDVLTGKEQRLLVKFFGDCDEFHIYDRDQVRAVIDRLAGEIESRQAWLNDANAEAKKWRGIASARLGLMTKAERERDEAREKLGVMEDQRASECDVLNTELRENYGSQHQVQPRDDWRSAVRALVDGAKRDVAPLREKAERLERENVDLTKCIEATAADTFNQEQRIKEARRQEQDACVSRFWDAWRMNKSASAAELSAAIREKP